MLEQLIQWDFYFFELLNEVWTHPFLDWMMPFWTNAYFWLPLYLFVGAFVVFNYPHKSVRILAVILLTVFLADQLSSGLIKPYVGRLRPCQLPVFSEEIRLLVRCGSGKSFVSGHATNHFALAFCWIILFGQRFRWLIPVLLFWAASIAYSRVYVGVHFPADIFFGGILGTLIGLFTGYLGRVWADFRG